MITLTPEEQARETAVIQRMAGAGRPANERVEISRPSTVAAGEAPASEKLLLGARWEVAGFWGRIKLVPEFVGVIFSVVAVVCIVGGVFVGVCMGLVHMAQGAAQDVPRWWDHRSEIKACWEQYERKSTSPDMKWRIAARCESLEESAPPVLTSKTLKGR